MNGSFKNILSFLSAPISVDTLAKVSGQGLVLPFYHSVTDDILPHITHLYKSTPTYTFSNDIDYLLRHFKPIEADHLHRYINDKKLRQEKTFLITFDDGLSDFYHYAAPILLQKGVQAICFVNTDFVDNKAMFYRLKTSLLIDKLMQNEPAKSQTNEIKRILNTKGIAYAEPYHLLQVSWKERNVLDKLAEILDVDFQDYLLKHKPYMSTEQINELIAQGFIIGAHSCSHPYYPELSAAEQVKQTVESIQYVAEQFGSENRLFSFPFTDSGLDKEFFSIIESHVDITFGTAALKLDEVDFNFQRIPMELPGRKNMESVIKTEYLIFILKKLLNKHIIKR